MSANLALDFLVISLAAIADGKVPFHSPRKTTETALNTIVSTGSLLFRYNVFLAKSTSLVLEIPLPTVFQGFKDEVNTD